MLVSVDIGRDPADPTLRARTARRDSLQLASGLLESVGTSPEALSTEHAMRCKDTWHSVGLFLADGIMPLRYRIAMWVVDSGLSHTGLYSEARAASTSSSRADILRWAKTSFWVDSLSQCIDRRDPGRGVRGAKPVFFEVHDSGESTGPLSIPCIYPASSWQHARAVMKDLSGDDQMCGQMLFSGCSFLLPAQVVNDLVMNAIGDWSKNKAV